MVSYHIISYHMISYHVITGFQITGFVRGQGGPATVPFIGSGTCPPALDSGASHAAT